MGEFVNPGWINALAWITAAIIISLNVKYLSDFFGITDWLVSLAR
jgi:Mn2+/Fe2+ NRAMP family transporter